MSRTFFPIAEFESRHERVRAAMDDLGIDLLLVLAPSHVNYLIGTPAKGYQEFQVLFFPREPGPLTLLTRLCEVPLLQAESLADLRVPGFDFHGLRGSPRRFSIHVNGPWCITFEWQDGEALRVDLEQYH